MTKGERIRIIRTFRGITQRELGLRLGYEERYADTRISQYETDYRVPKKDTIIQIAEILDVNYVTLMDFNLGSAEDIMQTLFWLDETSPGTINLFQLVKNPGKCNSSDDKTVRYNDTDDWPAHAPVGLWFNYGLVNEFMQEWLIRKEELKSKKITREEYFEWKLNWPSTCDGCGKNKPTKKWNKLK